MTYIKDIQSKDFYKALGLSKEQVNRLNQSISDAYDQRWHANGPNIDQINALVAPSILTPEEAFYAATVILSDVFGAMMKSGINRSMI